MELIEHLLVLSQATGPLKGLRSIVVEGSLGVEDVEQVQDLMRGLGRQGSVRVHHSGVASASSSSAV